MKLNYFVTICLLVLFGFSACKKDNTPQPEPADIDLCVQRIDYSYSTKGSFVTDSQMDTVKDLFSFNGLSLNNLQVYSFQNEKKYSEIHVYCNQFTNGLLLLFGETGFHFRKDPTGYLLAYMPSNLVEGVYKVDSSFKTSPLHAANILYRKIIGDLQFYNQSAGWADSCYTATLGVTPKSTVSQGHKTDYKLVWEITPKNNQYPYCIVDVIHGTLEYYNDGIIN